MTARPDLYRERLVHARHVMGLPLKRMAALLRTPHQSLSQWESGKRRTPGAAVVAAEMLARLPVRHARRRRKVATTAEDT